MPYGIQQFALKIFCLLSRVFCINLFQQTNSCGYHITSPGFDHSLAIAFYVQCI